MKIIGVNGSVNKTGNTFYMLDKILKLCEKEGAQTELINAAQAVSDSKTPFCVCCSTPCTKVCYAGTQLEQAYQKIEEADAVIFGSPVYFGSMTAQLKAFFDKTRDVRGRRAWVGIPAAAVSVGASKYGGQETTINAIQDCLFISGMTVFGSGWFETDGGQMGVGAHRPAETDEWAVGRLEALAKRAVFEAHRCELYKNNR
jgi:multimeric flavodoxin WrbA